MSEVTASQPAGTASDAHLIQQSWRQPDRFAEVFDRHAATIHRYLARRIGPAVADDLLADTFLAAFEQRQRYDPACVDARPWLYGIATNLLRRHHRSEARQYRAFARTGVDPVQQGHAEAVTARVAAEAAVRTLVAVLAELPARDRDMLLLVAWEQLSYAEVATALDIRLGTVRSRLHRARRRLQAALRDAGHLETLGELSDG
jgi:RNA polymerase sigma factor (sigma-70 family)